MSARSPFSGRAQAAVAAGASALLWGVFALCVPSACTQDPDPSRYDGTSLGYCIGEVAKPISASACKGCSGGTAYALCNGNSYNECACDLPSTYSLDSGVIDTGLPVSPDGAVGPYDGGVFLPCCMGKVVLEIPASACSLVCPGKIAYAVCVADAYTECACEIPEGYALPTFHCDGG